MATKKSKALSRSRKPKRRVNAVVRAEDERLREELRHADMRKFDTVFNKAIRPIR